MDLELDEVEIASIAGALASVLSVVSHLTTENTAPTGIRGRPEDIKRGKRWLDDCMSDPQQLYDETRLRSDIFRSLVTHLMSKKLLRGSKTLVEEKLLIFLYICAQGASWRNMRWRCGHSLDTISQ